MARMPSAESLKLRELAVGEDMLMQPKPSEPLERALLRWRNRLSREAFAFRARIDGGAIRIQRTLPGKNRQTADLAMMKPGTYLLLKTRPTPADAKRAWDMASYATSHIGNLDPRYNGYVQGSWLSMTDQHGRLLIYCFEDVDGNSEDHVPAGFVPADATVNLPWGGEWP